MRLRFRMMVLVLAILGFCGARAQTAADAAARAERLAYESGCTLCHSPLPRASAENELLPIGPAWQQIARRYQGREDAVPRLVATVLQGSGTGGGDRHWAHQSSGEAMLPNSVEISAEDAERVVRWILSRPR